ncbi:fluoride efflux transporter CrcB [Dictyobacter aurantiacus]|uniref:Fluoride-specific ion channel FluC n=1 Tax=Dictyobacter aurantiacus TaxID=1936993 RepID=A0A401ZIB3_9CHLR|nr:fluoride efflux transporter CrcB [Dictyobacter aurantiacus]GCE06591.1 hypothetical protein KDAU_39200 [Dictyobacter aurantiacus]
MRKKHFNILGLVIVFCGGFLGTVARYLLSHAIQASLGNNWPYDILLINITGAFALSLISTLADASLYISPARRLFLNVGFMGAYTTFSSLALGDFTLLSGEKAMLALLYLLCSIIGGIIAVVLGQILGLRIVQRHTPATAALPELEDITHNEILEEERLSPPSS